MNSVPIAALVDKLSRTAVARGRLSRASIGWSLALVMGGLLANAAVGEDSSWYRINVSSTAERAYTRFSKEPYREHGKSYAIISVKQATNLWLSETRWTPAQLVKQVNEVKLLAQLRRALASRGFHEAASGQKPDVVLNVLYGRSRLVNPYTGEIPTIYNTLSGGAVPAALLTKKMLEAESMPGGFEKIRRAGAEKLYIAVYAWKYPETAQEKPQLAWRTIINTDDPEADLNLQSEKMLMAGAAFFDRPIDDPEVTFSSELPPGRVEVGTPTVVESKKAGK